MGLDRKSAGVQIIYATAAILHALSAAFLIVTKPIPRI
jgi:hypothetical protein